MKMHQKFATKNADYLPAILAGDTDAVAHILHTLHYYTANEVDYQAGMRRCKKQIDAKLGPVTPATPPADGAPLSNQTLAVSSRRLRMTTRTCLLGAAAFAACSRSSSAASGPAATASASGFAAPATSAAAAVRIAHRESVASQRRAPGSG